MLKVKLYMQTQTSLKAEALGNLEEWFSDLVHTSYPHEGEKPVARFGLTAHLGLFATMHEGWRCAGTSQAKVKNTESSKDNQFGPTLSCLLGCLTPNHPEGGDMVPGLSNGASTSIKTKKNVFPWSPDITRERHGETSNRSMKPWINSDLCWTCWH